MMMTSIALTLCYKLPFPLMNNHNSLKLMTKSYYRQPQLTRGHLTAPQNAAPSHCAVIHVAAASNAASNLTTMLMSPLSHVATTIQVALAYLMRGL